MKKYIFLHTRAIFKNCVVLKLCSEEPNPTTRDIISWNKILHKRDNNQTSRLRYSKYKS